MMEIENQKTICQLFIKNIFKLSFLILILSVLTSCVKELEKKDFYGVKEYSCGVSGMPFAKFISDDAGNQKTGEFFFTEDHINFTAILSSLGSPKKSDGAIEETEQKNKNYNSIFFVTARPSSGYSLDFKKAELDNNILHLYFEETSPQANEIVLTVVSQPYCLLKIDNINQYEVDLINK